MNNAMTYINLLKREAPSRSAAWSLAAVMVLTLGTLLLYGSGLRTDAAQAQARADGVTQQLKDLQARMALQTGEQAKAASAKALREEIDALKPQAEAAQTLVEALRATDVGRTDEFMRALLAMTRLKEPGLWLTSVSVGNTGKRLELKGEAQNGGSVLRFAHRANEAVQPLSLRMDTLDVAPSTNPQSGPVSFTLN